VYELKLPDLGEGIHEGEILKWYVQPGEAIAEDAPLLDVETDKAAVTIPSPVSGQVLSLGGKVGDVVTVGSVIVVIDTGGEATSERGEDVVAPAQADVSPAAAAPAAAKIRRSSEVKQPVPAAPATRRLARQLGVDLRLVTPSGPAGRVTPEDVHRHAAGPGPAVAAPAPSLAAPSEAASLAQAEVAAHAATAIPFLDLEPLPDFSQWGPVEVEALRSIRRKVAHKMTTSMILAPHVAHMDEADVTDLEAFRRRERERRNGQPGGHLTLLAFVVKAVTAGLRATPAFNASLDPFAEQIIYKRYYNIGIAADTGKGLVVPVIKETDRRSIIQISAEIERLVAQAREGALDVEDLRGGTFTITNVGPLGGTALIPAINYPEVAILGMGKVQEKPVVREGQIVIRKVLPLTLAFDHRIADGADAARFVSELVRQLSDPNLLLLET
jgi:pyruvate dehydrogenase E2 component (dihydrolipoamide acetyltransferase)